MFLADFHIHSNFSDGKMAIPEVVDLYGKRGFGAIAITDHLCESATFLGKASVYLGCTLTPGTFPLYLEILKSEAERAWDQYRMVVLPGFEVTKNTISNHRSAHILGLGVSEFVDADADVIDITRRIRSQGALTVAAHPVWTRKIEKQTFYIWDNRRELESEFDAWEVASGPHIFDEVAVTKLPKIASSDMHVRRQLTSWKTVLDCERHPEAILQAIRQQQLSFTYYEAGREEYAVPRRTGHVSLGVQPVGLAVGGLVRA
jgi:predicted metal-dependent phosphoesterase TrpH